MDYLMVFRVGLWSAVFITGFNEVVDNFNEMG